jgi:cytochrome c oxidase subunit 2
MGSDFPLFPEAASTFATSVDRLFLYILGVAVLFSVLIFVLVAYFAVRYRRRPLNATATQIDSSIPLEIAWTAIPLGLTVVIFIWGANLFMHHVLAPPHASDIYVVGKQWMWKLQHPEGPREINELHVAAGRPFRLVMTSEDAIHSFFVPAFRIKQDVLPGRYTTQWFQATKTGRYHLFCTQYCGTNHATMGGWIYVLEPGAYSEWLSRASAGESMATVGDRLFGRLRCGDCHGAVDQARGPTLAGLYGRRVSLAGGGTALADDAYIETSILDPNRHVAVGYQPLMPTFKGQVTQDELLQLLAYIKSLKANEDVP